MNTFNMNSFKVILLVAAGITIAATASVSQFSENVEKYNRYQSGYQHSNDHSRFDSTSDYTRPEPVAHVHEPVNHQVHPYTSGNTNTAVHSYTGNTNTAVHQGRNVHFNTVDGVNAGVGNNGPQHTYSTSPYVAASKANTGNTYTYNQNQYSSTRSGGSRSGESFQNRGLEGFKGSSHNQANFNGVPHGARILDYQNDIDVNGGYQYHYDTENGISAGEQGTLKVFDAEHAGHDVHGYYGFVTPEGTLIRVHYDADEFGYRPVTQIN